MQTQSLTPAGLRPGLLIAAASMLVGGALGQALPFMVLGCLAAEIVLRRSVNHNQPDPLERLAYHSGQFPPVFYLTALACIVTMLLAHLDLPHPVPAIAGIAIIALVIPAWLIAYYRRTSKR